MAFLKAFGIFFAQFLASTWLLNYYPVLTDEFVIKPAIAGRQGLGLMNALPLIGGFGMLTPPATAPAPATTTNGATGTADEAVGYSS